MNQYYFLHRMKWPALLVVFGITALLDEYDVIPFSHSWPLYLIVFGVMTLAERALLAQIPPPQPAWQQPWPGAPGSPMPGAATGGYSAQPEPSYTSTSTSISPVPDKDRS